PQPPAPQRLRALTLATTLLIYMQLILGASLRHEVLGLLPHILGAVLATLACLATAFTVLLQTAQESKLRRLAYFLSVLVIFQVILGVASALGTPRALLATAHVGTGALLLGTSLFLTLWSFKLSKPSLTEPFFNNGILTKTFSAIGILLLVLPKSVWAEESNYGWGLPVQASTFAPSIDWALQLMHAVMILLFVLWGIFLIFCLIRYRQRAGVRAVYAHKGTLSSFIPDGLILAFEIWLIFFVGVPIWSHVREKLPKEEEANMVEVVAEQFTWNIHYPGSDGKFGPREIKLIDSGNPIGLDLENTLAKDDLVTINELHIPLGKPTLVYLSSKDVIHSFFIPEFRIKQDVTPGLRIPIWFEPTKTGKFEIGCAQLCGLGHFRMRGDVYVHTPEEYESWLKEQLKAKG
ncbi:MAG: hypothetical protein HY399_08005, partial [Elusimicrobia bacterium]|nr:hypothetical protein [Elusimicrobiota bacterium]